MKIPVLLLSLCAGICVFADENSTNDNSPAGKNHRVDLGNGITMDLLPVPAGAFNMGRDSGDDESYVERAVRVSLSRPFSLGKTEVTQAQFAAVMGTNPSWKKGDDLPAESVSWLDAVEFCKRLTARERAAGRLPKNCKYALPTEAQWEYACRAGTTTRYAFGNDEKDLVFYGNFFDKSSEDAGEGLPASEESALNDGAPYSARVASYLPNLWGFHDMHGNVWEWCADAYRSELPGGKDPLVQGNPSDELRVLRGGGFFHSGSKCDSTTRICGTPDTQNETYGFRVALVFEDAR